MAVTPTGMLSVPLGKLKSLLAASPKWIEWTTAPLATSSIHLVAKPSVPTRPYAVISHEPRGGALRLARHALGSVAAGMPSGRMLMTIEADITSISGDDGYVDEEYTFTNNIGAILEEMSNLAQGVNNGGAAGAGHLCVNQFTVVQGPLRLHPDQGASSSTGLDRYRITIAVDWADFVN